jgi:hypothetical protein
VSISFVDHWTGALVQFPTVVAYEESPYWRHTRTRYERSDQPQACVVCGGEEYQLHHLSYRSAGYESLEDLMALCGDHHWEVEKHIQKTRERGLTREQATHDYLQSLAARAEGDHVRTPERLAA